MELEKSLALIAGEACVKKDEPMLPHCTFRAGGSAEYFVTAEDESVLKELLEFLSDKGVDHFVLGNGSNVLVSDSGYKGVIIKPGRGFEKIEILDERLKAGSAVSLIKLSMTAAEASLTGLEFASGIPGSIGGAVYMNAGAYGGEIKDCLEYADIIFCDGNVTGVQRLSVSELSLSYRHSLLKEKRGVVVSAGFKLEKGDDDAIRARIEELKNLRVLKQPLDHPSAGSTFKRPEGYYAAKLIEEAGFKGLSEGDACVSEKHSGFIVNKGKATASDIYRLMCRVEEGVYKNSGVRLEPEVILLGDF